MASKFVLTDADAPGIVIKRKPVNKFDESQARDYHGRWTSDGGGAPEGWQKLTPDPAERQKIYDAVYALNDHLPADENAKNSERYAKQNYDNYFKQFDRYTNGKVVVDIAKGKFGVSEEVAKQYIKQAEELQAKWPLAEANGTLPTLVVTQDALKGSDTMGGYTAGRSNAVLIAVRDFGSNEQSAASHMPAAEGRLAEYSLAHEWGHAWSGQRGFGPANSIRDQIMTSPDLSVYGRGNVHEAYAEVFAQAYMESKYPDVPTSPLSSLIVRN